MLLAAANSAEVFSRLSTSDSLWLDTEEEVTGRDVGDDPLMVLRLCDARLE